MRNATKRRSKAALSALAVAGMAAWAGAPSARGDFTITVFNQGVQVDNGNSFDVFVLAATNTGTNNTGSTLAVVQAIIDTGGPSTFASPVNALGIDIEKLSQTGAASNTKYNANVNGTSSDNFGQAFANNQNAAAVPIFGDVTGGTFVGVGTGKFTTDLANNGVNTQDGANELSTVPGGSKGGTSAVYVNGQTSEYLISGNTAANYLGGFLNKAPQLDNAFENGSNPTANVNAGNVAGALLNGKVHSLEVDSVSEDSGGNVIFVPDDAANGPVPFANIVVPVGVASFTVHGGLAGESGGTKNYFTVINVINVSPPPPSLTLTLKQTGTGTVIGTAAMVGSNGNYLLQNFAVSGPAQTAGQLVTTGWNPINDHEIFGLREVGATSLSQLISDLQNALQTTGTSVQVEAPTGAAGALLASLGDNIEIDAPNGSGSVSPSILSYDLSQYTGNGTVTITQVTVIPEPTSLGALALGGLGLLSRRRRKARA